MLPAYCYDRLSPKIGPVVGVKSDWANLRTGPAPGNRLGQSTTLRVSAGIAALPADCHDRLSAKIGPVCSSGHTLRRISRVKGAHLSPKIVAEHPIRWQIYNRHQLMYNRVCSKNGRKRRFVR